MCSVSSNDLSSFERYSRKSLAITDKLGIGTNPYLSFLSGISPTVIAARKTQGDRLERKDSQRKLQGMIERGEYRV